MYNDEQRCAIATRNGFVCVVAAAGSGKTTVFVERAKQILKDGCLDTQFLGLTYTKEAASEMERRAQREPGAVKLFRTFHSWALEFVRREVASFPFPLQAFPLATPYLAARILGKIVSRMAEIAFKDTQQFISTCKRKGISPDRAEIECHGDLDDLYIEAYRKYNAALKEPWKYDKTLPEGKGGLLDFDSLIVESVNLLERRTDVRARWQYRYVQVDEAQDTDAVQWRLVQLLSETHGNVFAVGDENQGMYSWRGSESDLAIKFEERFHSVTALSLPENYRSSQTIVEYSQKVAPIQNDTIKKLRTSNAKGVPNEFRLYKNEDEEAQAVLNAITDLGNTAVLARTNRQLLPFEDWCGQRGLRYKLLGKSGFWSQGEIKDVVAFTQRMLMPTDASTKRILSCPYECTRFMRKAEVIANLESLQRQKLDNATGKPYGLHRLLSIYRSGDSTQDELVRGLDKGLQSLRGEISNLAAGEALQRIVDRMGILSYYEDDDAAGLDNDPVDNIRELLKIANSKGTLANFLDYVHRVARAQRATKGFLTLSTIHGAKGKEWDTVFVAGVNADVLPHKKGEFEEERRIYFVAITRPRKRLHVSANGIPSQFIEAELPSKNGEAVATVDKFEGFRLHSQELKHVPQGFGNTSN